MDAWTIAIGGVLYGVLGFVIAVGLREANPDISRAAAALIGLFWPIVLVGLVAAVLIGMARGP